MTRPVETMEAAPLLGVPLPDAEPAPGCANCRRWVCRRDIARTAGDLTRVSDCNVMIRRCTHCPPLPARSPRRPGR